MKKLLFILLLLPILSSAQTRLDSLLGVWNDKSQPDSNRVQAYKDYIQCGYLYSRPDSAEVMAEALHVYAKEYQYPKASTNGYNIQGLANWIQGNYPYELHYSLCFHPVSQKSSVLEKESGITLYKSVKIKEILNSDQI